jgi:predicted branched-subunit amino acid permease
LNPESAAPIREFRSGLFAGLPIFLGYLSVSFGIGIAAVHSGMSAWESVLLSLTNVTSAGQVAGIEVIAAGGSLIEIIATQFVINLRYALMALSLSQKCDESVRTPQRLLLSYGITDEIFALCAARPKKVTTGYMGGIITISVIGWVLGTFLGSAAGEVLPPALTSAMGIMLYGMFVAIFLPAARGDSHVGMVVLAAAALSCVFRYGVPSVSSGFSVILCSLAAAFLGALLFPIDEEEENPIAAPNDEAASHKEELQ